MNTVFYLIFLAKDIKSPVHTKELDFNITDFNFTQTESDNVKWICKKNRDLICKANLTRVCTVREINETFEYKEFENSCYLFFSNLCEQPENEFYIVEAASCTSELTRRHYEFSGVEIATQPPPDDAAPDGNDTKADLRTINVTRYDVYWCPVGHRCAPASCPNVYHPVCMTVNHKLSNHPKFYTFVNHCELDRFYCTHYAEFEVPPPHTAPKVDVSELDWSRCSAERYLKFLYTNKAAASMDHYGWLEGDERYSKILGPQQRKPGYG